MADQQRVLRNRHETDDRVVSVCYIHCHILVVYNLWCCIRDGNIGVSYYERPVTLKQKKLGIPKSELRPVGRSISF